MIIVAEHLVFLAQAGIQRMVPDQPYVYARARRCSPLPHNPGTDHCAAQRSRGAGPV